MAVTYQFIPGLRANSKVLNLWNGSSNNAPPANWETLAFDDSAWATSSTPNVTNDGYPSEPSNLSSKLSVSGAEALAPWTNAPSTSARFLVRVHFTLPAGYSYYMAELWNSREMVSGTFRQKYINGRVFLTNGRPLFGNVAYGLDFSGGDNVLAMEPARFDNWSAVNNAWVATRWVVYTPETTGLVFAWGTITPTVNDKGVLGVGDALTHTTPTPVDLTNVTAHNDQYTGNPSVISKVVSNGTTTLMLSSEGTVFGCGDNSTGLLHGNGVTDTNLHLSPVLSAQVGPGYADIGIGRGIAFAIARNGDFWVWGPNAPGTRGQTGAFRLAIHLSLINANSASIGSVPGVNRDFIAVVQNGGARVTTPGAFNDHETISVEGNNFYGQLGFGQSGNSVLTVPPAAANWQHINPTIFGAHNVVQVSAGNDQLLILLDDGRVFVCGRGAYGSLGYQAFAAGSGADRIVSTPIDSLVSSVAEVQQAGPLSFLHRTDPITPVVGVWGDGVPYGGAGDGNGTVIYGTTAGLPEGTVVMSNFPPLTPVTNLAGSGAGMNNTYILGSSQAVFAAVGVDQRLYTWGWGGAAQMGSGSDPVTNRTPVAISGLAGVRSACVVTGLMFVVADIAGAVAGRGRSYAQMVGD